MDMVAGRVWADERRPVRHIDWVLLLLTAALIVAGLFLLYSATASTLRGDGLDPMTRVKKQVITAVIGLGIVVVIASFDYRFFKVYAGFIYLATIASLLLVRLPGLGATDATGTAQRWFEIAGFQLSPAEAAKLAVIVMVGAILSEIRTPEPTISDVVRILVIAAIPLVLVFLGPDIGTTLTIVAIVVGMLVVAGTKLKHLLLLTVTGLVLIFLAFQLGVIKDFQRDRLLAFLDRATVSEDARYNLEQSEIAVGAGGLTGVGYGNGTQTNLDYVPEQHTDFIFTAVGEELGFAGAATLLALFAIMVWRMWRSAQLARDPFGTLVCIGVLAMFLFQIFENVGMTMGIMPITGIPLPFVSYGGSATIADFIAIGLVLNVHARRFS
jgi:rod shape determining protein RodA